MEKIGRNDLCPCGSGKKYKKCCFSKAVSHDWKPYCIKLFSIFLILCLGAIVYSNTFYSPFHLDDTPSIVNNFFIRNLSNLQNIWNYLPRRFFLYLSIAFNYHFSGLDVFGYHLFNLGVHLLVAILVWWLTLLTLSTPAMKENKITRHANLIALLAGLVFVSHPVQIEAVTYIVQRAASMAALFYLLSLSLYVKSRLLQEDNSGRWKFYYIGSLISAIAAMFTKEITITLPLMVLLYEFSFLRTKKEFDWKYLFPFILTILIIPLTMFFTESVKAQHMRGVTADTPADISSIHYLLTQFRVLATYIRLVFLPVHQNLDYDYPISKSIFEIPTLFSLILLICVLFGAKHLFLKYRLVSFSIFWFFLTLLPESSLLPIKDVIFEHRLYLPLAGYSIFLVSSVFYLWGDKSIKAMNIVLAMVIACNSVLTYQRNKIWKDDLTLWDDTVAKSPHKARPHNNRGQIYYTQGKVKEALREFNKAIELDSTLADAYYNRGLIYYDQGKIDQALNDYDKAIEINPNYAIAYNNRGNAYAKQGLFARAISDFNKAIEINFMYAQSYNNRGSAYEKEGNPQKAVLDYNKAIEINPDFEEAYGNRGQIYYKEGHFAQALEDYNKAIELNPRDADTYNNRALVYYYSNEHDKSWSDVHKVESLGMSVNPQLINALKKAATQ